MFKGKEALYKINALFKKFGFDVSYYDTFTPDKKVSFYDMLGDTSKQPVTKKEINQLKYEATLVNEQLKKQTQELKARLAMLESYLKVEFVNEKQASYYKKIK